MRVDPTDADLQYIKAYFGLGDSFPTEQLICQDPSMKKVYFISKELSDYLYMDSFSKGLNLINMGAHAFSRNVSKFGGNSDCIYRIAQEGILNILPYMTKRVIRSKDKTVFDALIMNRYNGWNSLLKHDPELLKNMGDITVGCFVFVLELPDGNVEALTMHKFDTSMMAISSMISKDQALSLHMRYLTPEQREQGKGILEAEDKNVLAKIIKSERELYA
jgi:hypothetical protein